MDNLKLYQFDGDIPQDAISIIYKKMNVPLLSEYVVKNIDGGPEINHKIAKYYCFELKKWFQELQSKVKNGKVTKEMLQIDYLVEAFTTCRMPDIFHFNLGYCQLRSQFQPHEDFTSPELTRSTISIPGGYHEIKRHFKGHYWPQQYEIILNKKRFPPLIQKFMSSTKL